MEGDASKRPDDPGPDHDQHELQIIVISCAADHCNKRDNIALIYGVVFYCSLTRNVL